MKFRWKGTKIVLLYIALYNIQPMKCFPFWTMHPSMLSHSEKRRRLSMGGRPLTIPVSFLTNLQQCLVILLTIHKISRSHNIEETYQWYTHQPTTVCEHSHHHPMGHAHLNWELTANRLTLLSRTAKKRSAWSSMWLCHRNVPPLPKS